MRHPQDKAPFQVTKVWARNFRSIANMSFELDRLTVLAGPNASGKSNVLDVLRFIKDALHFNLDAAISLRNGMDNIQHRTPEGQSSDIELGLAARDERNGYAVEYGFVLANDPEEGVRVQEEFAKIWHDALAKQPMLIKIEEGTVVQPKWQAASQQLPSQLAELANFGTSDLAIRGFIRLWWELVRSISPGVDEDVGPRKRPSYSLEYFRQHIVNMRFYHIFPNTIRRPQMSSNVELLDEDAGNLASVLGALEKKGRSQTIRIREALELLIPGVSDFKVTSAGEYRVVSLKHSSTQGEAWFDLSQESDGTIRLLALLVALHQGNSLPLMGLEEPELTVHPGVLAVLADLLNAASRHSQILVTTHSPDLIDYVTDYRTVEPLRIVELRDGATVVRRVFNTQAEAVKESLFSPGELHRMGELEQPPKLDHG